jgi:hypothetical protein
MARRLLVLSAIVAVVGLVAVAPASARPAVPRVTVKWTIGPTAPFNAARFDGGYVAQLNRVYFLGFRTDGDATTGEVWYYDVATSTYTDTGVAMPVPVSNYEISVLRDAHGTGLYIFGGRDANGVIVTNTQVYYPVTNQARDITTDPWPGTTPLGCVSLPGMGVATVSNKAIVVGGVSFVSNGCLDDNSAQTWIFNPQAPAGTRWSAGPNLNVARGYITTAVLGKTIYAIGGDVNTGDPSQQLAAQVTVEGWRFGSASWNDTGVADLPEACDEAQAFGFGTGTLAKQVVLASCGQWPNGVATTYDYDSVGNAWSSAGAIKDLVRNEAGEVVTINSQPQMFIFGGYDGASSFVNPTGVSEHANAALGSAAGLRSSPQGAARSATTS